MIDFLLLFVVLADTRISAEIRAGPTSWVWGAGAWDVQTHCSQPWSGFADCRRHLSEVEMRFRHSSEAHLAGGQRFWHSSKPLPEPGKPLSRSSKAVLTSGNRLCRSSQPALHTPKVPYTFVGGTARQPKTISTFVGAGIHSINL